MRSEFLELSERVDKLSERVDKLSEQVSDLDNYVRDLNDYTHGMETRLVTKDYLDKKFAEFNADIGDKIDARIAVALKKFKLNPASF